MPTITASLPDRIVYKPYRSRFENTVHIVVEISFHVAEIAPRDLPVVASRKVETGVDRIAFHRGALYVPYGSEDGLAPISIDGLAERLSKAEMASLGSVKDARLTLPSAYAQQRSTRDRAMTKVGNGRVLIDSDLTDMWSRDLQEAFLVSEGVVWQRLDLPPVIRVTPLAGTPGAGSIEVVVGKGTRQSNVHSPLLAHDFGIHRMSAIEEMFPPERIAQMKAEGVPFDIHDADLIDRASPPVALQIIEGALAGGRRKRFQDGRLRPNNDAAMNAVLDAILDQDLAPEDRCEALFRFCNGEGSSVLYEIDYARNQLRPFAYRWIGIEKPALEDRARDEALLSAF